MKILAVRGANLASLAGHFALDFEAPPLGEAGIFAITGRTGSGKSTLLDAICLALYDRIPRTSKLEKIAERDSDRDDHTLLRAHDVRTILRTGTAEGHAEVDFLGRDQKKYRARWEVRRARRKVTGKLMAQQITLTTLPDGEQIGGKKTETLKEIRERIGLEFEQFSRTVLLSQGEFDAFLKAKESERAILLEALTGTTLYSHISESTYKRAKEEREKLALITTQLGENSPLSTEERGAAEQQVDQIKTEVTTHKTVLEQLQKEQAWYLQQQRLTQEVTQAQVALEEARKAEKESRPQQEMLGRVKKAQALRPDHDRLIAAETNHAQLKEALERSAAQQHKMAQQESRIQAEQIQATQQFITAQATLNQAQDDLKKAADLDTRINRERDALGELDTRALSDQQRVLANQNQQESLSDKRQVVQKSNQENTLWLQENRAFACLEQRLDEIVDEIHHFFQSEAEIKKREQQIAIAQKEAEQSQENQAALLQERKKIEPSLAQEERQRMALFKLMAQTPDLLTLQESQRRTKSQAEALSQHLLIHQNMGELQEKTRQNQAQHLTHQQEEKQQESAQAETVQQLERLTIRLEEARRADQLLQASAGEVAEALREMLCTQQPCPVCGATEHPFVASSQQLSQRAQAQAQRLAKWMEQEGQLRQQKEQQIKNLQQNRTQQQHLQQSMERAKTERDAAMAQWHALYQKSKPLLTEPLFQPANLHSKEPLSLDQKALQAILKRLEQQGQQQEKQIEASHTHRQEKERLDQAIADKQARLNQVERELITHQSEGERARHTMAAALQTLAILQQDQKARQQRLASLHILPPQWQQVARINPEQIITQCRQDRERWMGRQADTQLTQESLLKLESDLQSLTGEVQAATEALQRTKQERASVDQRLATVQKQRASLWGGEPTQQVKGRLEAQLDQALKSQQAAQSAAAQTQSQLARLTALKESHSQQLSLAEKGLTVAKNNWENQLQSAGLSHAELTRLLRWDEEKIAEEHTKLERLQKGVTQWQDRLEYRQKIRQEQAANNPPQRTWEQVEKERPEHQHALEQGEERLALALGILQSDNQKKERAAALLAKRDQQQEVVDLWNKLNLLIGSSDGSKFRKFAQSLTLDRLIELANEHLAELTPRYRLQRAVEGDLSLQVIDLEMGGERRGVANLSGGERFLTSLAMALGLAGMSGNRGIQVQTLFIDEGFGALDENSLNMAISALEALQSTGRQVGVISHIAALTERIGLQIQVTNQGGGQSHIELVSP
ncbi:MAG: hypothetical protein HQL72_01045 [Magnetococcales bacterium]|nr:hypothetical protein [Magnetococcales bacterium]